MDSKDRPSFVLSLAKLAAAYGRTEPTEPECQVYWEACDDLTIDQFEKAVATALKEVTFFPPPAVLRELAPSGGIGGGLQRPDPKWVDGQQVYTCGKCCDQGMVTVWDAPSMKAMSLQVLAESRGEKTFSGEWSGQVPSHPKRHRRFDWPEGTKFGDRNPISTLHSVPVACSCDYGRHLGGSRQVLILESSRMVQVGLSEQCDADVDALRDYVTNKLIDRGDI